MIILNNLVVDKFYNIYECIKHSKNAEHYYIMPIHFNPTLKVIEVHKDQIIDINSITKH